MNPLIFGKDQTTKIVNISIKDDKAYIFKQDKDGRIESEVFDYSPWALSNKKVRPYSERLKGDQYYKYITSTTTEKFLAAQQNYNRDLWLPRRIEECIMLEQGMTYFKDMKVEDVSILSFDIETSGLVMDSSSRVYVISNTFRKNGNIIKKLFSVDDYDNNDYHMIESWCKWVKEIDPSIIAGHNILSYDLPYLNNRCFLNLGRDGSDVEFREKMSKFRKDGSQQYEYHDAKIMGREIIDTFFLSIKYDLGREFPSYGLKPIIKHLGLEKTDRTFIDASQIKTLWKDPASREKIKAYALDDSEDALKLYDIMIPSFFYLNQSIPKTFQQMINEASGSHLDALMIRSYLQDGYSQPMSSGKTQFEGAISMGVPGIYDWVKKADVASLYPSIMLEYKISDKQKDPNGHMSTILEYFRDERLRNKKLAKETGQKYYDDLQNSQKIVINSLYGFLGTKFLLYNYPEGASEVTRKGREILLKAVEWATGHTLEKVVKHVTNEGTDDEETSYEFKIGNKVSEGRGYTLVNVDTDSFSITNGNRTNSEEFKTELQQLNNLYPSLIRWEDDGIYEKVIVIRAKNYVLVKEGKVKYKGSAITDQKKEPALLEMLENMIKAMLAGEKDSLPQIYKQYITEANRIKDVSRWVTKKTVTKSVLKPSRLTEQKVLDAIHQTIDNGIIEGVSEGDKIWLYNSLDGEIQQKAKGELQFYKDGRPKMTPNRILKDYRLWKHDPDSEHYIGRVYATVEILSNLLPMEKFLDYNLKSNKDQLKSLTCG